MSYTDIHFHLLPGVDDGPQTIEESIELAAAAFAEGTRTIVVTPHSIGLLSDEVRVARRGPDQEASRSDGE